MDQLSKTLIPQSFRDEFPRHPEGALHETGRDGQVDSDHPGFVRQTSFYTRLSVLPGFGIAVATLVGLGVAALFQREPEKTKKSWF